MGTSCDGVGKAARAYLSAQVTELRHLLCPAQRGDDEAVHQARTATRRLRTALSLTKPALGQERVESVRAELRELGQALGAVRDPTVELRWLRTALDSLPAGTVAAPVRARLTADRSGARRAALSRLARMDADHLLDRLDGFAASPWPDADKAVRKRIRREWRRLRKTLDAAEGTAGQERDEALHAARKQARRARYAAELVGGKSAERSAARARALQDALGAQHDAVLVRAAVEVAGRRAQAAGEQASSYDRLRDKAQEDADAAEEAVGPAARRARKRGHLDWAR